MTRSITGVAVPSEEEIAFSAAARSTFLIVVGPAARQVEDVLFDVVRVTAPHPVRVEPPEPGFVSMEAISRLCAALLPVIRREAPELLLDAGEAFSAVTRGPRAVREVGVSPLAEAVTFAVTRRISRESHEAALVIDSIARALLEAGRRCPSLAGGLALLTPDLHTWDRPSLRCLYRLVLLAEPADRVSVTGTWVPTAGTGEAGPLSRIGAARERFLGRLAADGVARTVPAPLVAPQDDAGDDRVHVPDDEAGGYGDVLLAMGEALVLQNYERVYVLAHTALRRAEAPEQEAQARRLIGIADAQLDDFAAAADELGRAVTLTADASFAAHLHYLQGLIATKRNYDLDDAERHYARGLAALGGNADGDGADESVGRRVERAWLHNGRALVTALRARAADDAEERDRLTAAAFALEFSAYGLAQAIPGAAPAYLRHNLLANITFLLEVAGRYDEAVRFWRGAFEAYLADDSHAFRVSFGARLGLLLAKAGRPGEGARLLTDAREACAASGDRFGEEELCLKLAYVHALLGDHEQAYRTYQEALATAHDLREGDVCDEALTGMAWSLAELGAAEELAALRDVVARAAPGSTLGRRLLTVPRTVQPDADLVAVLTAAGIARPAPAPKLRPYIPAVDLEGAPSRDLNRYLAWGGQRAEGRSDTAPALVPSQPVRTSGGA